MKYGWLEAIISHMAILERLFGQKNYMPKSPVALELASAEKWLAGSPLRDDLVEKLAQYLRLCMRYGLDGQEIVDSCTDLALTLCRDPDIVAMNEKKIARWEERRKRALSIVRPPRTVAMELDPVFFEGIMTGAKTFEGRAYKPESDKNYPDLREGDFLRFSLSQRRPEFGGQLEEFGLRASMVMIAKVADVYFAPRVHWMYQFNDCSGEDFQPMIDGPLEILNIQRAAVYYKFPGYKDLIEKNGFIGIRVANPVVIKD